MTPAAVLEEHTREPTRTECFHRRQVDRECLTLRIPSSSRRNNDLCSSRPTSRGKLKRLLLNRVLDPLPITGTLVGSTIVRHHSLVRKSERNKNHKRIEPALPLNERKPSDAVSSPARIANQKRVKGVPIESCG